MLELSLAWSNARISWPKHLMARFFALALCAWAFRCCFLAPSRPRVALRAWEDTVALVQEEVPETSSEEATAWLQAGFAWTPKSRRFWRKLRNEDEPELNQVRETLKWLKEKGLATKGWLKRFPEVLGLEISELEKGRDTAPSYLKSEEAYNKAIRSNPQLLGKNYDCLQDHESCQGRCSRCWNT